MACNPNQLQSSIDFRRQGDSGACQQFIEKNFDGIEPVEGFWARAMGYSFIIVAFTEIPEANLVEIVQAQRACERVDENCVTRRRGGNYVAEVQFEEVGVADYGLFVDVADYSEDEEYDRDEEEETGDSNGISSGRGRFFDVDTGRVCRCQGSF